MANLVSAHKVHTSFRVDIGEFTDKLQEDYGQDFVGKLERMKEGYVNLYLSLTTNNGRYAVRFYGKNVGGSAEEIAVLEELEHSQISAPRFVPNQSGDLVSDFNEYTYSVFEFLPGDNPDPDDLQAIKRIGSQVGLLQNTLASANLDISRVDWFRDKYEQREQIIYTLTDSLAAENKDKNIKAIAIMPSRTNTQMQIKVRGEGVANSSQSPEFVAEVIRKVIDGEIDTSTGDDIRIRNGQFLVEEDIFSKGF
jgi:Ser/Thr protein kinase RdoA (MazF antagonist)